MATKGNEAAQESRGPNRQERILTATRGLADFPACPNVKRLTNHEYTHRLRVGDWRILFNVFEEISIASIEEVKKRDESTY
jgi:mRNA-degrading endonuclease RelE of RelBE toxin-antitoxin system